MHGPGRRTGRRRLWLSACVVGAVMLALTPAASSAPGGSGSKSTTVSLSASTYAVHEGDVLIIEVRRTGNLVCTTTLPYTLTNVTGDTTTPEDYADTGPTPGELQFLPNIRSDVIEITAVDDLVNEPLERVRVTLGSPSSDSSNCATVTLKKPHTAVVTIDDDLDNDGIDDGNDNCPTTANASQTDTDTDGDGNACDDDDDGDGVLDVDEAGQGTSPIDADSDDDGFGDGVDNCPADHNDSQSDVSDGDGIGAACDPDDDNDSTPDTTDAFPLDPDEDTDTDADGVGDNADNCPTVSNDSQADGDGDGVGSACDAFPADPTETADTDADGVGDNADNCPADSNDSQADADGDGTGDACDDAFDVDGTFDGTANNPDPGDYDVTIDQTAAATAISGTATSSNLAGAANADCFDLSGTVTLTFGGHTATGTVDSASQSCDPDSDGTYAMTLIVDLTSGTVHGRSVTGGTVTFTGDNAPAVTGRTSIGTVTGSITV